jgi:hypothetical protein
MRNILCLIVLALTLVAPMKGAAEGQKRATQPAMDDLVGAWIGFEGGGIEFVRVELHSDGSGYLALVSPSNFITHDYGVQLYRVNRWSVDGWHIACDLSPLSSNAEPAQASAEFVVSSLRLEIHGAKRRWKTESVLYMESRVDDSNKEIKDAVAAVQKKQK